MVRMWEDEIWSDPDGVDVTALFDDIRGADDRQQYEAVSGLYFLADLRPRRLEPYEDEVMGLLGELPDFGLGTAGDRGGTRRWAAQAVGHFTRAYPHVVSELFDRIENGDRRTREDASRALEDAVGFFSAAPDVGRFHGSPDVASTMYDTRSSVADRVHDHHSTVTHWLHDECLSTSSTALRLLAGIAPWYCNEASDAIPVAVSHLSDNTNSTVRASAIGLLRSVALCNDRQRADILEQLGGELHEAESTTPELLIVTLDALVDVAEQHPESRSQIENWHGLLTTHDERAVRKMAANLWSLVETS